MTQQIQREIAIIGSGFSGSLLAWILAKAGRSVVVVDRAEHPRFAIGESSTPIADLLLEQLADEYSITPLRSLSRWGIWQRTVPHLRAGKKRGFSYFTHQLDKPFRDSKTHDSSLLVAASDKDFTSDTHWMRSDVDHWLFQHAVAAGAEAIERFSEITVGGRDGDWRIAGQVDGKALEVGCKMVVDASGSGAVLGKALGLHPIDDTLRVRTSALFGHFRDVSPMTQWLDQHGLGGVHNPFDADDAAQHHLLDDGWMWMLRFNDNTTSVGIVRSIEHWQGELDRTHPTKHKLQIAWDRLVARYPTISELLSSATLIAPRTKSEPCLGWIPRISRSWNQGAGSGWAMLPSSVGIVDPLHSTGIAHSLNGVRRVARLILADRRRSSNQPSDSWELYSRDVVAEIQWIDRIVACCYRAAAESFELFAAACCLYFIAAIHSERDLANTRNLPRGFLLHQSTDYCQIVSWFEAAIEKVHSADDRKTARKSAITRFRIELEPWNDVGLLDPTLHNRIARSISPKG